MLLTQKIIFKMMGFKIQKSYEELLKIKSLSRDEFKDWREKKRWDIVNHHFNNNTYYRSKFLKKSLGSWDQLPILNKKDLQCELDSLLTSPYRKKDVYIANTSGSSGHPFYFAKNKECHSLTWAYIKWRYESIGISMNDLQARFYGMPLDFFSNLKEKIKDNAFNRIRFPVFDFSEKKLYEYVKKFKQNEIDYIYGYTNSIVLFCRFLIKNNINLLKLCPSIKSVIVTSEVCTKEDRIIIGKALDVPLYDEYGASEFAYIGYQNSENTWLVSEEMVYVEQGEGSSILITDLHNKAYPFIRYNIGDLAKVYELNGQTFIESLKGRENDTISLPSGRKAAGLTFYYVSRSILEKSGVLKEFIIRQVAINKFIFDAVTDRPLTNNEIRDIKLNLDIYLEEGLELEINRVKKIMRPSSGKIKHFYSEIK